MFNCFGNGVQTIEDEEVMGKMIIGDVEVRKLRYLGDMSFMHIEKSFRVMSGLVWRGILSW